MTDTLVLTSEPNGLRNVGIPMHPATAMRLVKNGSFPRPLTLSPHKRAWRVSDLKKWIDAKAEAAA